MSPTVQVYISGMCFRWYESEPNHFAIEIKEGKIAMVDAGHLELLEAFVNAVRFNKKRLEGK